MSPGEQRLSKPTTTVVGRNLKRLRLQKDLSQSELARRTKTVSQVDVSRIERGETKDPSARILKQISEVLNVALDEFWRPDADPAGSEHESFQEFLADSDLSGDITPQETDELRNAIWPWGSPTKMAWYHALQAMRAIIRKT
jgi:transcriptional regulator with XRE-family HTH domain